MEAIILALEDRLNKAIYHSHIDELDALLSPDFLSSNLTGQTLTKDENITAHRSHLVAIESLKTIATRVLLLNKTAVVSAEIQLIGCYQGQKSNGYFYCTRVWSLEGKEWQVIAEDIRSTSDQYPCITRKAGDELERVTND